MSRKKSDEEVVRTTVTFKKSLAQRIRRAMSINNREWSAEIAFGMEKHVKEIEQQHGLTSKQTDDD